MSAEAKDYLELIAEQLNDLNLTMKRIAAALEAIQQVAAPEHIEVGKKQGRQEHKRREKQERTYKSAKELISTIQEEAPTLHENIKTTKRFPSGDFIVKIDYVDMGTFKKIAREAEQIGGEYSKKYRGFIFKMGE